MKKLLAFLFAMMVCTAYGATEQVNWILDEDTFYAYTSCTTGDNVTMPTQGAPTKNGYTFKGWKQLTSPENWKQMIYFPFTSYTPTSTGTGAATWTATGNYGTLTGSWRCSSTSATANTNSCWQEGHCTKKTSPSTSGTTRYCWCKGTSATFNGSTTNMSSSLAWVFSIDRSSASSCASGCAVACGDRVRSRPGFRRAVFGVGGA